MSYFEDYFTKILCINLDSGTGRDVEPENINAHRWHVCQQECAKFGLTKVERFAGCNWKTEYFEQHGSNANAVWGCATSHLWIMREVVKNQWSRVLILEDDFKIVHDDFHVRFEQMIKLVPDDWDMLYLGGHYGERPIRRINDHVIQNAQMLTTSSYAVTPKIAKIILEGDGEIGPCGVSQPIDAQYGDYHRKYKSYIFQPRLMVQRDCYSIIEGRPMNNVPVMMDRRHEGMV